MESPNTLQSPQGQAQQQQQQLSNSSRNLKIWFDEFKAKVSKKNQQNQSSSAEQTNLVEEISSAKSNKEPISSPVTISTTTKVKASNSGLKKLTKISTTDSPDFDTASIRTIFNRRDSRYEAITPRKQNRSLLSKCLFMLKLSLAYLIPFDYNLPWKLICILNTSFVIIVIGLVTGSSQSAPAFTFVNGFLGGLASGFLCFIVFALSFMAQVLPKSHTNSTPENISNRSKSWLNSSPRKKITSPVSIINNKGFSIELSQTKLSDFSLFEILDGSAEISSSEILPTIASAEGQTGAKTYQDDYKGWMIEFIGDYEQRNTADIKLKSIYVKIENRILHLCKPKSNHDTDSPLLPVFANQRVYDLNNVQKFSTCLLIPKTVKNRQKYIWSKKYPIHLEFQEDSVTKDILNAPASKSTEGAKTIQLTLFAKSCREKEEWFRRFKKIFEENRLFQGQQSFKRCSIKSVESAGNESINESFFNSLKRFRRRSPSPKSRDFVQTSQSYHMLHEPRQTTNVEDYGKKQLPAIPTPSSASLNRTRSCESLHNDKLPETNPIFVGGTEEVKESCVEGSSNDHDNLNESRMFPNDDSTLTRETAELFGQAIEYSNFIEAQPTLDYQEYIEHVIELGQEATSTSDWFNALTGRIFYDVFSHDYWSVWFKRKIQRKLHRIRLPYFMETLTLTKIDLGTNAPQFLNVASHNFDSYGLSIDFDMSYNGGISMTFETKLNLLKIKSDNAAAGANNTSVLTTSSSGKVSTIAPTASGSGSGSNNNNANNSPATNNTPSVSGLNSASTSSNPQLPAASQADISINGTRDGSSISDLSLENVHKEINRNSLSSAASTRTSGESSDSNDSDSDSSSDSSFDEAEANEISDWEDYGAEKTRQNIVKFVDKIASSRYFQHATENRFIKKKLQDISNCPLVLVVQIQSLNGVLTLNVPPPQTDRIWYGFKPMPELILKATPKMGDREVNLSHVTDWIERKLAEEFKKILVIPNMEDIVLPVLKSDHLQYVTATK